MKYFQSLIQSLKNIKENDRKEELGDCSLPIITPKTKR